MAEEGTPPATAAWDPEQVGAWVLGLDIPGKEAISQAVVSEEVDGDALLGFKDQIQVKAGLGISTGKANKLWAAIGELRAASAGAESRHGTSSAFAMLPRSSGTEAWTHASSLLQNTWTKKERYTFSRLVEVQEIQNLALQSRFDGFKASMRAGTVNGNELMLFHGCAHDAIESIARTGFLKTFQTSAAGPWQRYGPGFYFAMHASKSHEYPVTEMQALPPGKHFRTMILCKVARGNVLETSENMDGLQGSAPDGYDSIHGVATADGPLNYDELVVFAEEAILPYAVVTYEYIKHDTTLPHGGGAPAEETRPEPAAEQLFEVTRTGEILTKEQVFEAMMAGSVTKSEVRSLEEAAAAARDALAASVAGATANAEVLERGAAEVARVMDDLGRERAAVERAIDEEIAAVRSALNASLDRRSEELRAALTRVYDERHAALDAQRADVAQQLRGQRELCAAGAAAMEHSDRQVVERLAEAQAALQAARVKAPEVVPQRVACIHRELNSAPALVVTLQEAVAAFGEVGRPKPELQSYADPRPAYAVGQSIAPNVPVGEHLQGARFEAHGLPAGLAIDPATGVLSGSLSEESDEARLVTVTACNETGKTVATLRVDCRPSSRLARPRPPGAVLQVSGAGSTAVNGFYKCTGTFLGKPEYRKVGLDGEPVRFEDGGIETSWFGEDDADGWKMCTKRGHYYQNPTRSDVLPTRGWIAKDVGQRPIPRVEWFDAETKPPLRRC